MDKKEAEKPPDVGTRPNYDRLIAILIKIDRRRSEEAEREKETPAA